MKMADTLLEAAVDSIRLEDEWYHFGGTHRVEGLAHRLLQQILQAPVPSAHQRKLSAGSSRPSRSTYPAGCRT